MKGVVFTEFLESEIDTATLIRDAVMIVTPVAEKNGNTVHVDLLGELGPMHADEVRVRQVILNLLSNACKFTKNGRISVLASRELVEGRDWLTLAVTDTGIGMTEVQMGKLFQEFSQADASTTRKYGGTGLGLAISRHLSRFMGGDIQVQSVLDQGSTFTVRLPFAMGVHVLPAPSEPAAFDAGAPRADEHGP